MAIDYNDIICQAIDTIVSKKIEGLEYDKTIIATIVDDSDSINGHYVVNDGSINFDAYSEDVGYAKEEQVYVTVPKGDFTQTKIIVSKYTQNNDTDPIAYQSPLDSVYIITNNIAAGGVLNKNSILANGKSDYNNWRRSNTPPGAHRLIWEQDLQNNSDYLVQNNEVLDVLAIKADFMCALNNTYNVSKGNYGIIIELSSRINSDNEPAQSAQITRFYLDTFDMLGNPYSFSSYVNQQKKFNIAQLGNITHINIYLYQGNNFYSRSSTGEETLIPTPLNGEEVDDTFNNIFVNNLEVYFGMDIANLNDNTFKIYTTSSSTYDMINPVDNQKIIIPLWINKDETSGEYIGYSDGVYDYIDYLSDTLGINYDEDHYLETSNYYNKAAKLLKINLGEKGVPETLGLLQAYADGVDIQTLLQKLDTQVGTRLINCIRSTVEELRLYQTAQQRNNCSTYLSNFTANNSAFANFITNCETVMADDNQNNSFLKNLLTILQNYGRKYVGNTPNPALTGNESASLRTFINNGIKTDFNSVKSAVNTYFNNIYSQTPDSVKIITDSWKESADKVLAECDKIFTNIDKIISYSGNSNNTEAEQKASIYYNINKTYNDFNSNNFQSYEIEKQEFLVSNSNRYCIYWYRYVGENASIDNELGVDTFMPKGWERITKLNNYGLPKEYHQEDDGNYYFNVRPTDARVAITVGDESLSQEQIQAILIYDHKVYKSNILTFFNTHPALNQSLLDQVSGLYLQLTNEEVDSNGNIKKKDTYNSKETYQLYGISNYLINTGEKFKRRTIRARYRNATKTDEFLKNDCVIYWLLPLNATMLDFRRDELIAAGFSVYDPSYLRTESDVAAEDFNAYTQGKNYATDAAYQAAWEAYQSQILGTPYPAPGEPYISHYKEGYLMAWKQIDTIIENGKEVLDPESTEFFYYIKDYYIPSFTNNTIYCTVVKRGSYNCSAEQYFTFASYGTNGTDYSLCIVPATKQAALRDDSPLQLYVAVYDVNGDILEDKTSEIEISWYKNFGGAIFSGSAPDIFIKRVGNNYTYCILQAKVDIEIQGYVEKDGTGSVESTDRTARTVTLTAYYPVPYASQDFYLEGATTVVYDSLGTNPSYYNGPYTLFHGQTSQYADKSIDQGLLPNTSGATEVVDMSYYSDSGANPQVTTLLKESLPKIKFVDVDEFDAGNTKYLSVPSMYLVNDYYASVNIGMLRNNTRTTLFIQPILIIQNRFSSPMLNNWDGELTIDKENGTILATMVGAGKKERDNTFSGVLMGDVTDTTGATADRGIQGLYGFHHSEQSFGFRNDGTAFIGKSGKGRIEFDGNSGVIQSASYDITGLGMKIDLDDGEIDMRGAYINNDQSANWATSQNNNEVNGYNNNTNYSGSGSQVKISVTSPFLEVKSPTRIYYTDAYQDNNFNTEVVNNFWDNIKYYENQNTLIDYLNNIYNLYNGSDSNANKITDINNNVLTTIKVKHNTRTLNISSYTSVAALATAILGASKTPTSSNYNNNLRILFLTKTDEELADVLFLGNGSKTSQTLLKVGMDEYYLQTDNYRKDSKNNYFANGKGFKLDLMNGSLDAYNFKLSAADPNTGNYVTIDSNGTFFEVGYNGDNKNSLETGYVKLISISNSNWVMHSQDWYGKGSDATQNTGIEFDLRTGRLTAYKNFKLYATGDYGAEIILSSFTPYLSIKGGRPASGTQTAITGAQLIYIGSSSQYIQSLDFSSTSGSEAGMKINLTSGRIEAYKNFKLYATGDYGAEIVLSSSSPYLSIKGGRPASDGQTAITGAQILYIGTSSQYMQSLDFSSTNGSESGMKINFTTGRIEAYKNFKLYATGSNSSSITLSSSSPYLQIVGGDGTNNGKTLMYVANGSYYLQSLDFSNSSGAQAGVKFDLANGKIEAYKDFRIYAKNTKAWIVISSVGSTGWPYLEIQNQSEVKMIHFSEDYQYIRSADFSTTNYTGMELNLKDGTLQVYKQFKIFAQNNGSNAWIVVSNVGSTSWPYLEVRSTSSIKLLHFSDSYQYLQSNNYSAATDANSTNGTGMYIDLAGGTITSYSGKIQYGDATLSSTVFTRSINNTSRQNLRLAIGSNFAVSNTGVLYASSGNFSGDITSTNAQITGGSITLKDSSNNILFSASQSGVEVKGKITATSGEIGGCSITNGTLYITEANISGNITASHIDAADLHVSAANIDGKLTASQIDVDFLTADDLTTSNLTVDSNMYFNGSFIFLNSDNNSYIYSNALGYTSIYGLNNIKLQGNSITVSSGDIKFSSVPSADYVGNGTYSTLATQQWVQSQGYSTSSGSTVSGATGVGYLQNISGSQTRKITISNGLVTELGAWS